MARGLCDEELELDVLETKMPAELAKYKYAFERAWRRPPARRPRARAFAEDGVDLARSPDAAMLVGASREGTMMATTKFMGHYDGEVDQGFIAARRGRSL
eukprot:464165-Pyramimonas_sp.AAC.1